MSTQLLKNPSNLWVVHVGSNIFQGISCAGSPRLYLGIFFQIYRIHNHYLGWGELQQMRSQGTHPNTNNYDKIIKWSFWELQPKLSTKINPIYPEIEINILEPWNRSKMEPILKKKLTFTLHPPERKNKRGGKLEMAPKGNLKVWKMSLEQWIF
jgi:hypothetical protein